MTTTPPIPVLIADDDPDDRLLLCEAFRENRLPNPLHFVEDGQQLLDCLRADASRRRLPGLILLDLNMPRLNGREALLVLKADPLLQRIPVVILSTAACEEETRRCLAAGAAAFISKPDSYSALLDVVRRVGDYWLATDTQATERQPS